MLPERMFCESTRAHNCVEIDGLNYSRFRKHAFGSALEISTSWPLIYSFWKSASQDTNLILQIPNNKIQTN